MYHFEEKQAIKLEPRQKLFCDEYLKDLNATAAAKRAGYSGKNAANTGSRILARPQAKAYIDKALAAMNEQRKLSTGIMHQELIEMIFSNLGDIFDEHGDIKNLNEIPEYMRKAVDVKTTIVRGAGGIKTITTYTLLNRIQLMEKLALQSQKLNFR